MVSAILFLSNRKETTDMLKSRIHDLLKADKRPRTVIEIANALGEEAIPVLRAISEMHRSREIYIVFARSLTPTSDQSTYYSVN